MVTTPPDPAPPPAMELQCVCWMCSVNEDSVRNPMEHWLQKKAWFPSTIQEDISIIRCKSQAFAF